MEDRSAYIDSSIRPWGHWGKLAEGTGYWIKEIFVDPGSRLSLQKHTGRSEVWTIIQGEGYVTLNSDNIPVKIGSVVEIALGDIHRITNISPVNLIFIEVAYGPDLRENDIIRLEDDWGRT